MKVEPPSAADITSVTVSIGVAGSGALKQEKVQQVIAAADKALYRAKAAGRNRVEAAGLQSAGLSKMAASRR